MNCSRDFSIIELCSFGLSVAFLLCLADMPYGFYLLIRFFTMVMGIAWAVILFKRKNNNLAWISVATAVLFQPNILKAP